MTELGRDLLIPEPVIVEVDQLLRSRVGGHAARRDRRAPLPGAHTFLDESATVSGGVAGQGAAGAPQTVVECYCGSECCEAGEQSHTEVLQGAGAVMLEREDVLAGPEDRAATNSDYQGRARVGLDVCWSLFHRIEPVLSRVRHE